jgi:hypothetical protein
LACRVGNLPDSLPLLAYEEKKLAALDRAAQVPAVVVKAKGTLDGREEIARVQLVVPEELEQAAVESVFAATGDDID